MVQASSSGECRWMKRCSGPRSRAWAVGVANYDWCDRDLIRAMVFPTSDRVLYGANPLEQVICQLRFPPILRIDSDNVAEFQEAVRQEYPLYSEEGIPELPLPPELAKAMGLHGPSPAKRFSSADEHWTIALARDFVALTTEDYERWEGFRERLRRAIDALEQVYRPAFYTRVGLRYKNIIHRSKLGLDNVPWSELLASGILSELGSNLAAAVTEVSHVALVDLGEAHGKVRIRHGLVAGADGGEQAYSIDADFFMDRRIEPDAINNKLDYFNTEAARFFRWCFTETLHRAMAPQPIG